MSAQTMKTYIHDVRSSKKKIYIHDLRSSKINLSFKFGFESGTSQFLLAFYGHWNHGSSAVSTEQDHLGSQLPREM